MPKLIQNDDGTTEEVYTKADLDAERAMREQLEAEFKGKIEEKDKYVDEKLDQFMKARQADEGKQKEVDEKLAEAKKIAEETSEKLSKDQENRLSLYKDFVIESFVGADPELKKAIEEAGALVNIPRDSEANVKEWVKNAIKIAGLDSGRNVQAPMYGGYAPVATVATDQKKDEEFQKFVDVLGLGDLVKKPESK